VSIWIYLSLISGCLLPPVIVKHVSLYIYRPCTYIFIQYAQVSEGTIRPYCHCLAPPAPYCTAYGPRSPFSAHVGLISPCPRHMAGVPDSSPLSSPASQKDLVFSLQVTHILGAPSAAHLLLPLAGAPGSPLVLAYCLPCLE